MKSIQMVDLYNQYSKIQQEIENGIFSVIETSSFVKGGKVVDFQKDLEKYLGVKHVIPVANGTDALQIALMSLGLKAGDEVITPTFTFISTAEVVALLGLTPVVVDVDFDTFCIDIQAVKRAITPKTKAIVPVHLFGQNANMEAILALAKKHNLFVIEDACQSMGSQYIFKNGEKQHSGTIGDIGCTSFFPSKNLGCYGDGGAIFTNNKALAEKITMIANHGMKVRYHHDIIGVNSRLDSIQAAVLEAKLPYLNDYIKSRQNAADFYTEKFADCKKVITPVTSSFSTHSFHQYTLKLVDVD
ncbi:MAG: DegT/DnrJ/EryC1/StrS family aminotransferase, partial [Prevotellaceae bacterium]|nr:DegT/DnrJ/EryC1/StrS family aminotransferase [Prevotellaceae bacterium]